MNENKLQKQVSLCTSASEGRRGSSLGSQLIEVFPVKNKGLSEP
jgi:hypothetical protein